MVLKLHERAGETDDFYYQLCRNGENTRTLKLIGCSLSGLGAGFERMGFALAKLRFLSC